MYLKSENTNKIINSGYLNCLINDLLDNIEEEKVIEILKDYNLEVYFEE